MKKTIIVITCIAIALITVSVSLIGYIKISRGCGESIGTIYLDKKFISLQAEDQVIQATHYDPSLCKNVYKIKEGDTLEEVSFERFKDFLKKYNLDCNNCLVYKSRGFTPCQGYYDYATNKRIFEKDYLDDGCE